MWRGRTRQLDPASVVTDYVPELSESGYRGATVRDVLDMQTGIRFREEYTNTDAEVRAMERIGGLGAGVAF